MKREIRAWFDDDAIRVYQVYSSQIADAALNSQKFVQPFKLNRMTWIKPSFKWMMYRSGWGEKIGQERILEISVSRSGFEWALSNSCLSKFEVQVHGSFNRWEAELDKSPVRIQWDPERDLNLAPQNISTIQIGLGPDVVQKYVNEWIIRIEDVTRLSKTIHKHVQLGRFDLAQAEVPTEMVYPLEQDIEMKLGIR